MLRVIWTCKSDVNSASRENRKEEPSLSTISTETSFNAGINEKTLHLNISGYNRK